MAKQERNLADKGMKSEQQENKKKADTHRQNTHSLTYCARTASAVS